MNQLDSKIGLYKSEQKNLWHFILFWAIPAFNISKTCIFKLKVLPPSIRKVQLCSGQGENPEPI